MRGVHNRLLLKLQKVLALFDRRMNPFLCGVVQELNPANLILLLHSSEVLSVFLLCRELLITDLLVFVFDRIDLFAEHLDLIFKVSNVKL